METGRRGIDRAAAVQKGRPPRVVLAGAGPGGLAFE